MYTERLKEIAEAAEVTPHVRTLLTELGSLLDTDFETRGSMLAILTQLQTQLSEVQRTVTANHEVATEYRTSVSTKLHSLSNFVMGIELRLAELAEYITLNEGAALKEGNEGDNEQ